MRPRSIEPTGRVKKRPIRGPGYSPCVHGPVRPGSVGDSEVSHRRGQHVLAMTARLHPGLRHAGGIGSIPGTVLVAVRRDVMAHALARLRCVVARGPGRKLVIVRQRRQPGFRAILIQDRGEAVGVGRRNDLFRRPLRIRVNPPQPAMGPLLDLVAVAPDTLALEPDPLLGRVDPVRRMTTLPKAPTLPPRNILTRDSWVFPFRSDGDCSSRGKPRATRSGAGRSVEDVRERRSSLETERECRAPSVDLG